jgi:phage gpG-like protein
MADVEWHGDAALQHVRSKAAAWIRRACITVARRAKELLSVAGTAVRSGVGRDRKGRFKGSRITGAVRSQPGEPPRKQTGRLRASVTYEVDEATLSGRVGTNVDYGRYLELGTKRGIAPRPWLRRALAECQSQILGFLSNAGKD